MSHRIQRTVTAVLDIAFLTHSSYALAEVSDKEPSVAFIRELGLTAAILCLVAARMRPWLGSTCFVPVAIWFASLVLEIHSLDVGSYVLVEQGAASCQHTYASLAIVVVVVGLVFGRIWYRHKRS